MLLYYINSAIYVIVAHYMKEIQMIIVRHVILQKVMNQDVISVILKAFVLKLIMIISVNKEKDKEDNIRAGACLLIVFVFCVVVIFLLFVGDHDDLMLAYCGISLHECVFRLDLLLCKKRQYVIKF